MKPAAVKNETKVDTKPFYNSVIPSDWEIKALLEVGKIVTGNTPSRTEDKYWNGNICWATAQDFNDKYIYDTIEKVSEVGARVARILPVGSVLVTCIASIGNNAIAAIPMATNQQINSIIPKKEYHNEWIYYYLSYSKQRLEILAGKTAVPIITKGAFEKFKIPLPPLPEQKAIAQVLSMADATIHTNEKLIAQKELRKKWLMQNLLMGKMRLKGFENTKWKIQPLENFIKPIVREVPKPDVPYLGIGLRSHGKGTFLKHDEQPEKNSMDKFYVVRPNDLIVNITFAWEQAIAIVRPEDNGALASHRFPTYTFIEEKGHPDFFRFYILQPRMKFMLEMISPGGAGRNRVMSKSDFIKLEFLLPDYKEQTAIAQVLQAADKEISLLKAKAEKLREKKKGLMQQLLTGKIRIIKN